MLAITQMVVAGLFVAGGLFFLAVSSTGVLRLPDFYSRNHAVGKSETLGSILVLCGLAIFNGFDMNSLKLLIVLLFIAIANPTATHIVAQAAFRAGLEPWTLARKKAPPDENEAPPAGAEGGTKDKPA